MIRDTPTVDTVRGRAATLVGAAVVCLGAWAWALAATSMAAVRAAEARALGDGHTAEMPGQDELALVAHDARLAALFVVAAGLAIALSARARRSLVGGWVAGVTAAVVANAALGGAVDGGPVLLAASAMALVVGAAVAAGVTGSAVGARRSAPDRSLPAGPGGGRGPLAAAGALAAGTLPVLVYQGMGSPRYAPWVPADLASSNVVAASALTVAVVVGGVLLARVLVEAVAAVALPAAALAVLVGPAGGVWQVRDGQWVPGVVLALAAAPLVLAPAAQRWGRRRGRAAAGAGLVATGGALASLPMPLGLTAVAGGMFSMVVTGPAGATINYDGLPVVGGGALVGAAVLGVHLAVRPAAGTDSVPGEPQPLGVSC